MAATRRANKQQQAGSGSTDAAAAACAPPKGSPPPSRGDVVRFAVLQHSGFVLCVAAVLLIVLGYDAGWVHNTHLSMASLGMCLLGLFMHETRPVNRQEYFTQMMQDRAAAKSD